MNSRLKLSHKNIVSPKSGKTVQVWSGNTFAIKDECFWPIQKGGRAALQNGVWYTTISQDEIAAIYAVFTQNVVLAPVSEMQIKALEELVEDGYLTEMPDLAELSYKAASSIIGDARALRKMDEPDVDFIAAVAPTELKRDNRESYREVPA